MKTGFHFILLILFFWSAANAQQAYRIPATVKKGDYFEKTIVFRVKPEYRSQCEVDRITIPSLNKIMQELGIGGLYKMFPNHQPPKRERNAAGDPLVDLSLLYRFEYTGEYDLQKVLNLIYNDGHVIYANPVYIDKLCYTPNDPRVDTTSIAFRQYQLKQIKAYTAWDLEKGDTNVVIGIVDNGCQWSHPELAANVKNNYADPIDGVDNDLDGFTDNFHGWDVANNDNDPVNDGVGALAHGTHVAGDAAAVTDNGLEIASPGFKCKFLPVKIANSTGLLTKGYEGIVYAADHGCSIINCSWGQQGGALPYQQDVIDYATFNKNALVVAAAGNSGVDVTFYPASYKHVISVANVKNTDERAGNSNYNHTVDVSAPGEQIYSTTFDSAYTLLSGTSMSSPIAAGAAAIIKAHFPAYTAEQVGERLRMTCDNIDTVAANASYISKLGRGRINMTAALAPNVIAVRSSQLITKDGNDSVFITNDTLLITGVFKNFLSPVSNLTITLSSTSSYVSILQGAFNAGSLGTLDTVSNFASIYKVKVLSSAPSNATIEFKLTYSDGASYNDEEWFSVIVNADYINVTENDISTSITSNGRIGYNAVGQAQGLGFTYLNSGSLFFESSLMIGNSTSQVSDITRGAPNGVTDSDFYAVSVIREAGVPLNADFEADGLFNDSRAPLPMGVLVRQHWYAWNTVPDRKYIIAEYTIKNNGASVLNNLYAGIFTDWDIQNYLHNRVGEDASRKLGYAFCTDTQGLYAGIAVLSPTPYLHYAIDNMPGGGGGLDIYGGYTTPLKYQTLSMNRAAAGTGGQGNDICNVVSTGPFQLAAGEAVKVAFALLADSTLAGLQASLDAAAGKYAAVPVEEMDAGYSTHAYPNPANGEMVIDFSLAFPSDVVVDVLNVSGQKIKTLLDERLTRGTHRLVFETRTLESGLYFYRLVVDGAPTVGKMMVIH